MGKLSSGIPERYPISVARAVAFDDADPVGTVNITDFSKSQFREQMYCYKCTVDVPEHQHRQLWTKYFRDDVLHQVFEYSLGL